MESGCGSAEEIGYAFGNALLLLDAIRKEVRPDDFERTVKRISFFINSGIELVPEICKIRAYSRLWPALCKSEYGIDGVAFRAGCQVRSLTLTEQQPEVNILRIAYEALPVVLSAGARVNALQLPGFREAISLPDHAEQMIALRTQQVLMYETGITDFDDIFEGSKLIEKLTGETVERAREISMRMRAAGYTRAIGIVSSELTRQLSERQRKLEAGEIVQIGVNGFLGEIGLAPRAAHSEDAADYDAIETDRIASIKRWRQERDNRAVTAAREKLEAAAKDGGDVMNATVELARAGGTVGEWTLSIEKVAQGRYTPIILDRSSNGAALEVPAANRRIRIAIGKAGLDGHINAIKLLAQACMRSGMEVVLAGFKQTPAQLVETALQEDVDLLAVSSLAGAHMTIARETLELLKQRGASDVRLVMGGIIPEEDRQPLLDLGVKAVFTPKDSKLGKIIADLIAISA